MALIFEDENKTLGKKQLKVPDEVVKKLKVTRNLFDKYSQSKGFKRINAILDDDYNKRSKKKDKIHNGDKTISGSDAKKIAHEKEHGEISNNPNDLNNIFTKPLFPWLNDAIRSARTSVKKVKAVPPVPKLEKNPADVEDVNKPIKMGNASVRITESTDDWLPYYDALSEFDTSRILYDFIFRKTDKQQWTPLIQPDMYKKALSEFVRFGKFVHFPTKYVYQWMGIILDNTAKLRANTEWAGHIDYGVFPMGDLEDAIENYPEYFEKYIEEFGEPDEDNSYDWMDKIGFYDWMSMPDGSDAWSDYGLPALENVIGDYREDMTPEQTIVIINKALDCAHPRGDLSSIFIVGGSKTLSAISESIKRTKQIILTESQLLKLKEYHDQQSFNFDNEGNAYFEKDNWEHYVDFLEDLGAYGQLPASQWTKDDINRAVENAKNETDYNADDIDEDDYKEAFLDVVYQSFIYDNNEEDVFEECFLEYFGDYEEFKETHNYYDEADTLKEFIDSKDLLDDVDNLDNFLTGIGYRNYLGELHNKFVDKFDEYYMIDCLKFNERGLVYIERNITIPTFNSPDFNYDRYSKTYYDYLKKTFYDLGYCFSWAEGAGEAYCGRGYGGCSEIKLKCWIDPKDIDWKATVYKNCYSLREEREVVVKQSGIKIEVFDVVLETGNANGINVSGKSLLKQPIIIPY